MSFPLQSFESHIPKIILDRGLEYFQENNVDELTFDGKKWEAEVYGSETYLVQIKIQNGQVKEWNCDCPYEHGPICKHAVAVLFAIRDEISEDQPSAEVLEEPPRPKKRGRRPKQPAASHLRPASQPVKKAAASKEKDPTPDIIQQMSEAELRNALAELASRHKEVKAYVLSRRPEKNPRQSRDLFRQMVRSVIQSYKDRHGYIDYDLSYRLGIRLGEMVLDNNLQSPLSKTYLLEEVIRQVAEIYPEADDSGGDLGMVMDDAFSTLHALASDPGAAPDLLERLFRFGVEESLNTVYGDFGSWDRDLLGISCAAVRNKDQADHLMSVLDQRIGKWSNELSRDLARQHLEKLKLGLIAKWRSEKEAQVYLNSRLHYPDFRRQALEKVMAEKRYEEARRLALDGIELDTKNGYPGLVNDWRKWLIRIAEAAGDTSTQVKELETLYFKWGEIEYFRQLKKIVPKKDFGEKVERYIRHFRSQEGEFHFPGPLFNSRVAQIFVEENRLDELLDEVRKKLSLLILDQYFDLLSPRFPAFFIESYERNVRREIEHASNRSDYRRCCGYVQKIHNLGGTPQAKQILQDWRAQYPRRPALLEEIGRVKL